MSRDFYHFHALVCDQHLKRLLFFLGFIVVATFNVKLNHICIIKPSVNSRVLKLGCDCNSKVEKLVLDYFNNSMLKLFYLCLFHGLLAIEVQLFKTIKQAVQCAFTEHF